MLGQDALGLDDATTTRMSQHPTVIMAAGDTAELNHEVGVQVNDLAIFVASCRWSSWVQRMASPANRKPENKRH